MKRHLATLTILVLSATTLAACGGSSSDSSDTSSTRPAETTATDDATTTAPDSDTPPTEETEPEGSDNPFTEGVPSCDDLTAGVDMAQFEQGCVSGDTLIASLGYSCNVSDEEIIYVAPDEDAGEIYYGVPGEEAMKGSTAEDFFAFMDEC